MFRDIILLFIVLILCVLVLRSTRSTRSTNVEPFFDLPASHKNYVENSSKKFNPLTSIFNPINPVIPFDPAGSSEMSKATQGLSTIPNTNEHVLEAENRFPTPDDLSGAMKMAKQCEAAPKTCSAFDDATFAKNCGMSFDIKGLSSEGNAFTGGLFISPVDRDTQVLEAEDVHTNNKEPYDPYKVYQPTLGRAKAGTFGITKDTCIVVKEKVDCSAKQTFNSPNCTQCYTSQTFSRVGPDTKRLPSSLLIVGTGMISVTSSHPKLSMTATKLDKTNPITITIPDASEGLLFDITLTPDTSSPSPYYLAGTLTGKTARGTFQIDMTTVVQTDKATNSRPRISGTTKVNGFRCKTLIFGAGKNTMVLACMMPFTFINMYDGDTMACDNGPIITQAASATFLESDPCYGKANQPGNYKLECLQNRWIDLGGTTEGTGYPSDQTKANAIQKDANGKALDIDEIVDILAPKMVQAQTGTDAAGNPLTIPEWNTVSMWATGVPINTPCDGPNKDAGPLSKNCLDYLYANRGSTSRVGSTYTLPMQYSNLKEGFEDPPNNRYNYPRTSVDPTGKGLSLGQSLGGVASAKMKYDDINRLANDNTKTNAERNEAIKQAFDIDVKPISANKTTGPEQVFAVGPDYRYTKAEAAGVCSKYGATVATTHQLQEAQKKGADWCFSGWVADGGGKWPISTTAIHGCGSRVGIIEWTPDSQRAGVNCYGAKPGINDVKPREILPFNGQMWDQPSAEEGTQYITVPSGYLQTSGPQPSCFYGLSAEQAQRNCTAMGSQCAGFSYSKDGNGHGCYKGNHAAGMVADPNYMGYVKIPAATSSTVYGCVIRFQQNHYECLNLAQLLVYSQPGGPNIIKPNMKVEKPSSWGNDYFPGSNLVNRVGNTFAHTSCGDIPWITVTLDTEDIPIHKVVLWNRRDCCKERVRGFTMSILNADGDTVYTSNTINNIWDSYAWYPPNPEPGVTWDEQVRYMTQNTS